MTRPRWLPEQPTTRARLTACPRCHAAVIRALDAPIAALDIRLDPVPLDIHAELAARLSGRSTYDLIPAAFHQEIEYRDPARIRKREYPVLAAHRCPGPIPATAISTTRRRNRRRTDARPPY